MEFYIFNNGLVVEKGMSGSDKRAFEWAKIFKARGHEVKVILPRVGYQRYKDAGFDCIVTSGVKVKKLGYFLTYLWQGLRACMVQPRARAGAVIYSSSDLLADVLPAIYMKLRNRKARWIAGLHLRAPFPFRDFVGSLVFPKLSGIYYFFSQRFFLLFMKHLATKALVSNHLDGKFLIAKGFAPDKVLVTYGGIDLNEIKGTEGPKKYEASFVGRLHPQKGIPDLFQAWYKVTRHLPQAKLAVIAEPDLEDYFKRKIKMEELNGNIEFLGFLDGREKYQVLKSSKLLIFPSYYESFGMVACEAMACGLPVMAYDLPVYREIYPQGMIRSPIGDVDSLSKNILDLLLNEEKRRKISEVALSTAKRFRWEKTADNILTVLGN